MEVKHFISDRFSIIIPRMTDIHKFKADVRRVLKHVRADNNGRYDSVRACKDIVELFIRSTSVQGELPNSLAEYWQRTYIDESKNPSEEPSEQNINRLGAILSFLENTDEDEEFLSESDWQMLGELVNYEAGDLPIEVLQNLMSKIVEKGAI